MAIIFSGQQKGRRAEGNQILVRLSPQMASRDCLKWPFSSWFFSALNPIYMTNSVTLKLPVSSMLSVTHSWPFAPASHLSFFFFLSTVIPFFVTVSLSHTILFIYLWYLPLSSKQVFGSKENGKDISVVLLTMCYSIWVLIRKKKTLSCICPQPTIIKSVLLSLLLSS